MTVELTAPVREQTRARYPDESGYVERDGVNLYYEVYGSGEPTVFLLPTWSIIHSRHWKEQPPQPPPPRRGQPPPPGTGRCSSHPSRATAAWSRSTAAATAARTARRAVTRSASSP